jgi:ATP-binding cassette subfamily F protein 3
MILSCKNISKSFGADEILSDVSFLVEDREVVALTGVNGAGKTTLLKIIAGEIDSFGGELSLRKGACIGYLAQMMNVDDENTVFDELTTVFSRLISLEEEILQLEKNLDSQDSLLKYHKLTEQFEREKGYEYKSRIRGIIKGLGFSQEEAERKVGTFSGGQKTRVAIGKLLLTEPDILLLDEPTNHLDIKSVEWLENVFLKNYPGAVIVVSHDRYFLDKVATKIIDIENKKAQIYYGNYSYYSIKKEELREEELRHFVNQQRDIHRQEEIIKKLKSFNRKKSLRAARSKEKRLDKMDKLSRPDNLPDKMWLMLEPRKQSGNDVLKIKNLSKTFGNVSLFSGVNFELKKGECAAIIGENGIGKTTLLKMIQSQTSGVFFGTNVEPAYFDQENIRLDNNKTIFDEISDSFPWLSDLEIRNTLAAFVFTRDDVFKKISELSGGERGRVAICKLMLSNANFLLLDEPTNHLDMVSKEILGNAIRSYTGTVLYISHDRYFINDTAEKIFEMSKNGFRMFLGNYDYYIERKTEETEIPETKPQQTIRRQTTKPRKEIDAEKKLAREIADAESELTLVEEELQKEDVCTDAFRANEMYQKKIELEDQLLILYEQKELISSV